MNKEVEAFLVEPGLAYADYGRNTRYRIDVDAEAERERGGARVGVSRKHESAHLHVAGEATYIDDMPELAGTLHAALGLSPVAHGRIKSFAVDKIRALPGVVDVIVAADIPGVNDCGAIVHDDPILADGVVQFLGQPVFAVIATDRDLARRAAAQARHVLEIEPLPAHITALDAHAAQSYVLPPMHLTRGDAQAGIAAAPRRLKGTISLGGQEQFYLEGQISYAIPTEGDGMRVHCSTQHPSEMQHLVAHALRCTRTTCTSNAGAWAAASAARNRSRASSRASPRWPRASCAAR